MKGWLIRNMEGWMIYNGFLPSEKFIDFATMFRDAAIKLGHHAKIMKNDELLPMLTLDKETLFKNKKAPDYVLFTDKDIYLAKQLELLGIPIFNRAATIETSDDKIKTYQVLNEKQLPIPKTIVAPKTYGIRTPLSDDYLREIIRVFGFPLIVKEAFGSFGEQVYLIENEAELRQKTSELSAVPYVFQQFISSSYGKDIRLQVVGDQVVAAMLRTSENDFRANVTAGGKMTPYTPTTAEKTLAIQASQAIDAAFSGVDLLFGENGEPIICEVNANAHIRNLLDCTGINAAESIVQFVVNQLQGGKQR